MKTSHIKNTINYINNLLDELYLSKIQIEYNKNTEYVEREGEVSFEKTTTPSKLVVKGHYLETDKVVEIRSEEI